MGDAVSRPGAGIGYRGVDRTVVEEPAAGSAGRRGCSSQGRGTGTLPRASQKGYRRMTIALLACLLVTFATLVYVFYLPGELHLGPEKTRIAYLRERKEAVYENLREVHF